MLNVNEEVQEADRLIFVYGSLANALAKARADSYTAAGDEAGAQRWTRIAELVTKMQKQRRKLI